MRPVVAVLAVGGSPFVEYDIMHKTWSLPSPPPSFLLSSIGRLLKTNLKSTLRKIDRAEPCVQEWFQKFKVLRQMPSDDCTSFFRNNIASVRNIQSVIVKAGETQTIVQCETITDLLSELQNMGWISSGCFYLQQNGNMLSDEDGNDVDLTSEGKLEDFGVDTSKAIHLVQTATLPTQASIGGFYTFNCSVEGKCIDNKYNAYSVQDKDGTVHVIYKQTIENIKE
jgi:hypothetical protein